MPLRHALASVSALTAALLLAGCASTGASAPAASAKLEPTRGNQVTGTLRFVQVGDVVRVSGEVSGLKPGTEHGFHIHEKGDCSSGDGMSAGGHFNPTGAPHGKSGPTPHHSGDLPSLKADANGVATFTFQTASLNLASGAATNPVGRGVIVHADPDDFTTQPTGNSGARLACGVVVAR